MVSSSQFEITVEMWLTSETGKLSIWVKSFPCKHGHEYGHQRRPNNEWYLYVTHSLFFSFQICQKIVMFSYYNKSCVILWLTYLYLPNVPSIVYRVHINFFIFFLLLLSSILFIFKQKSLNLYTLFVLLKINLLCKNTMTKIL